MPYLALQIIRIGMKSHWIRGTWTDKYQFIRIGMIQSINFIKSGKNNQQKKQKKQKTFATNGVENSIHIPYLIVQKPIKLNFLSLFVCVGVLCRSNSISVI